MNCELCGKSAEKTKKIQVEGTTLQVCSACARHGEEVFQSRGGKTKEDILARVNKMHNRPYSSQGTQEEKELALDYPDRISKARIEYDWTQEELSNKVNEKKSVISKIERGDLNPSEDLIKKLEKTLNVELKEAIKEVVPKKSNLSSGLTIGDLLKEG